MKLLMQYSHTYKLQAYKLQEAHAQITAPPRLTYSNTGGPANPPNMSCCGMPFIMHTTSQSPV
jgi:hypothetical protein